jgi:hypothetical protein
MEDGPGMAGLERSSSEERKIVGAVIPILILVSGFTLWIICGWLAVSESRLLIPVGLLGHCSIALVSSGVWSAIHGDSLAILRAVFWTVLTLLATIGAWSRARLYRRAMRPREAPERQTGAQERGR